MPCESTVLVSPKVAKGKGVDARLAKGAEKAMLEAALKHFKKHKAVKATKEKEGFEFEPRLTTLADEGGTLSCEIESVSHPLGKMKPVANASNSGGLPGGGARDVGYLIGEVMKGHVKIVEANLKRLK
ncbi:MAG: hypothetical protein AAGK04_00590 [Planctomycetota bacterium]